MPAKVPPNEDFTDVKETSERLGIGKRRLRDGVNHHGWPGFRMGRKLMFSPEDRVVIAELHRIPGRRRATA